MFTLIGSLILIFKERRLVLDAELIVYTTHQFLSNF